MTAAKHESIYGTLLKAHQYGDMVLPAKPVLNDKGYLWESELWQHGYNALVGDDRLLSVESRDVNGFPSTVGCHVLGIHGLVVFPNEIKPNG